MARGGGEVELRPIFCFYILYHCDILHGDYVLYLKFRTINTRIFLKREYGRGTQQPLLQHLAAKTRYAHCSKDRFFSNSAE